MKLKGINRFEQHVEKIVLGAVTLVFLGVLSMQFVLQPNLVDIGGDKKVPPDKIYAEVADQARVLQSALEDTDPRLPEVAEADLERRFEETMANPVSPISQIAGAFGRGGDVIEPGAAGSDAVSDGPVMALAVPPPAMPVANAQWSTVDPFALAENPDLEAFVPKAQPYDMATVSIEASFDGQALRAALEAEEEGRRRIPRSLWTLGILRVEAERQLVGADGPVGDPEPIVGIPSLTDAGVTEEPTPGELTEMVAESNRDLEKITKPEFVRTISGLEWLPPTEAIQRHAKLANFQKAEGVRASIAREEEEIAKLEQDKSAGPCRTSDNRSTPPSGRGGASTRGTGGTSGSGRSTADREKDQREAREARIERNIERKREDIERLYQELADLGHGDEKEDPRDRVGRGRPEPILNNADIRVIAHDLGVRPGESYRYRLRVIVNNPLFARGNILDPDDQDQQELARQPFSEGDWSEWSEPVTVGRESYFFVTRASEATVGTNGIGGFGTSESARGEVYQMYYGFYRRQAVTLQPGDLVETELELPEDLFAYDIDTIDASSAKTYLDSLKKYQDRLAREEERLRDPDVRPGATTTTTEEPPAMPAGLENLPDSIVVLIPTYLLDVIPGATATAFQVVLQTPDGDVEIRDPVMEQDTPDYRLAAALADAANLAELQAPDSATRGGQPNYPPQYPYPTDDRDPGRRKGPPP